MHFVKFQATDRSESFRFPCQFSSGFVQEYARLYAIVAGFQKILRCGTQAALRITGTHGRPNVKVESAPSAITSLSAACRCASHPPSNPSVLPPEIGTQSEMAGFSCILRPLITFAQLYCVRLPEKPPIGQVSTNSDSLAHSRCDGFCHFDGDVFCLFDYFSA